MNFSPLPEKESSFVDVSDFKTPKSQPQIKCRNMGKFLNSAEDGKRHADGLCTK